MSEPDYKAADEANKTAIVRLNLIIREAQRVIQDGGGLQEVWNALYIPPDIKYVPPRLPDDIRV